MEWAAEDGAKKQIIKWQQGGGGGGSPSSLLRKGWGEAVAMFLGLCDGMQPWENTLHLWLTDIKSQKNIY